MSKLVWNAIVKNEAAIIDRCINSLLPHIDGAIIVDTGSTDGTPDILISRFREAKKPIRLERVPFENFQQARNEALKAARNSDLKWDYLLLSDADMELKVSKTNWLNGAKGLSYDIKQTAGAIGYFNRRVVSCRASGEYVGVTHEYLDVATDGILDGVEFVDHADGANRPEKFSRDIALLEKALETETRPGLIQRYHFYLGQSYFDAGQWAKAAEHYRIRTTLGGFEEEVWNAQLHYAHCLSNLDDQPGFLWGMLQAYRLRPHRAESLYDLAKYFRERGDNQLSLLFSTPGMSQGYPRDDLLFVNNHVYDTGLREEFSICAFYNQEHRKRGAVVCNKLALEGSRQASSNLYWYLEPLVNSVPSFVPKRIVFNPPDGYVAMNPSISSYGDELKVLVRTVNYTITPEGQYEIRDTAGSASRDNPIHTRNFIIDLDSDLNITSHCELCWSRPAALYDLVIGLEDVRLFEKDGQLQGIACVRENTAQGWCEQVLFGINDGGQVGWFTTVLPTTPRQHEKNWMPWVRDDQLQFVYRLGTLIDASGKEVFHRKPEIDVSRISGGSQVVTANGIHMAVVHEAEFIPGRPHNRYYRHRFVTFANDGGLLRISPPFYLHDRQIEFAAGMAYLPEHRQLVISYGVRDCEAWLATMDFDEVIAFIAEGS
jgi:glycosyltransferase involved in cell wall biosynthesis